MSQTALDILKELHQADQKAKYPSIPDHAFPKTKFEDKSANGLTRCITRYITLRGGYAARVNSTGIMRKGKWTRSGATVGFPDITGVFQGRSFSIEVKVGRDKMSDVQVKQAEAITRAGGLYHISKNFEIFHRWWHDAVEPLTETK